MTIPFEKIENKVVDKSVDKVVDKVVDKSLETTRARILEEMRNNPNITQPQLGVIIGIGKTTIQNHISYLRKNGFIERIGSNKNGYWKVL